MKLLILSDLHAEFGTLEAAKDLDYDVAVLPGNVIAPGRAAASWLRHPARLGDKPIVLIEGPRGGGHGRADSRTSGNPWHSVHPAEPAPSQHARCCSV